MIFHGGFTGMLKTMNYDDQWVGFVLEETMVTSSATSPHPIGSNWEIFGKRTNEG